MKRISMAVPIALAAAAVAPAAATAATVTTDHACYPSSSPKVKIPIVVAGTQFTPGAPFSVTGTKLLGNTTVDATGAASVAIDAPTLSEKRRSPKSVPFQATDGTTVARGTFQVVNGGAIWDGDGLPRQTVKWSFGGLPPGAPVYVHVRRGNKTLKTTRIGKAAGACGTASKRLKRLPVRASQVRVGTYQVFVDTTRKFKRQLVQYAYRYKVYLT